MGFWSIVGIAFIIVMLIAIVLLIIGLFRRADERERLEDEALEDAINRIVYGEAWGNGGAE